MIFFSNFTNFFIKTNIFHVNFTYTLCFTCILVFYFLKTCFSANFYDPAVEREFQHNPDRAYYNRNRDIFQIRIPLGNLFRNGSPLYRAMNFLGVLTEQQQNNLRRDAQDQEHDSQDTVNTIDIQHRIRGDSFFSDISQNSNFSQISEHSVANRRFANVADSIDLNQNNQSQNSGPQTPNRTQQSISIDASEHFGNQTPTAPSNDWSVFSDSDSNHAVDLVGRMQNQRANRVMTTPSTEVLFII